MITLSTLVDHSPQEVFDQICTHLLTQMTTSKKFNTKFGTMMCAYRSLDDKNNVLKCAAGCLISDSEYNPSMECNNWENMVHHFNVTPFHKELIVAMQTIHDGFLPNTWEMRLRDYAQNNNLKFNFTSI
jgi:putative IMPACT (imprinted ancient) family translation regulator